MEGSMAKTEIIRDRVKSYFQHTVYGWLHLLVRIPNTETLDALRQARSQDGPKRIRRPGGAQGGAWLIRAPTNHESIREGPEARR